MKELQIKIRKFFDAPHFTDLKNRRKKIQKNKQDGCKYSKQYCNEINSIMFTTPRLS